jgi:hypothetical protein
MSAVAVDGACLLNNPHGNLLILLIDPLHFPDSLLVHSQLVPVLLERVLALGFDDFVEEDLVLAGDLGELLLGAVVVGALVAAVEEGHVE